jgi:hypothetical protein
MPHPSEWGEALSEVGPFLPGVACFNFYKSFKASAFLWERRARKKPKAELGFVHTDIETLKVTAGSVAAAANIPCGSFAR